MSVKSRHVPVQIDAATYQSLKAYSGITGIPVTKILSEALKDWMTTIGQARLDALTAAGSQGRTALFVVGGLDTVKTTEDAAAVGRTIIAAHHGA